MEVPSCLSQIHGDLAGAEGEVEGGSMASSPGKKVEGGSMASSSRQKAR
jgi:hypothetical protein